MGSESAGKRENEESHICESVVLLMGVGLELELKLESYKECNIVCDGKVRKKFFRRRKHFFFFLLPIM